ncbi:DUF6053 domain-containing protein [Lysobacter enzymogenes]|uniref:DUF6053 domain-containing protein n=1 Tax=Lysobacter enzymogenes TaxID=69 RepID=UPI00339B6578
MGGASAPMLFFQVAAIRPKGVGAEAPPPKAPGPCTASIRGAAPSHPPPPPRPASPHGPPPSAIIAR